MERTWTEGMSELRRRKERKGWRLREKLRGRRISEKVSREKRVGDRCGKEGMEVRQRREEEKEERV